MFPMICQLRRNQVCSTFFPLLLPLYIFPVQTASGDYSCEGYFFSAILSLPPSLPPRIGQTAAIVIIHSDHKGAAKYNTLERKIFCCTNTQENGAIHFLWRAPFRLFVCFSRIKKFSVIHWPLFKSTFHYLGVKRGKNMSCGKKWNLGESMSTIGF